MNTLVSYFDKNNLKVCLISNLKISKGINELGLFLVARITRIHLKTFNLISIILRYIRFVIYLLHVLQGKVAGKKEDEIVT